ncbi:hypothetical protein Bca101_101781 [Brassica carinata]
MSNWKTDETQPRPNKRKFDFRGKMVHRKSCRKVAEKSPRQSRHRTSTQASSCCTKHADITHTHSTPTLMVGTEEKLSSKILIFEFLASVIFATTWVIFATTWVIFATTWVIFATTWVIFAHEDCPWVIFAHEDCPSVHISARWPFPWTIRVILAHDDCPSVRISARWPFPWTVRVIFAHEDSTSHVGPVRGLSVGDFRPRGLSVGDFRLRGLSVGDFRPRGLSVSTHISTLALPVDCPGDFRPRGLSVSTHISTLALPVDYPWVIFAHEDCPWVIFAYEDCPSVRISARWPFPWTVRVIFAHEERTSIFAHEDCPWVIFAHEDCPSVRISARWPFPWTVRVIFAHEDSTSHVGPSRGLSVGDFRPRGLSVGDFRPRGLSVSTHISTLTLPVDCLGDFRPRGLSVSTHISTLALPVDYPWVIFAHEDCPWVIFAHEDCPWVIFAHDDCPSVRISARWPFPWTVRHVGPSRGLSVGDFRPRGLSVGDFRLRGLSVGDFRPRGLSVSTHISTLALPVDCPGAIRPRGLSVSTHISTLALPVDCPGDFRPRGQYISTHISTLALPVDYPWVIFAYEDCPWVIFAHEDCPSVSISARLSVSRQLCTDGQSTWTVWVIFAHEDCPLVHISARWPFPWTVSGQLTHVDSPSEEPTSKDQKQRRYERLGCHKPVIPVISVLVELILGHLRYLLTDVPPQPNSPPDNVLRRIDRERVLGLKEGVVTPPPIHGSDSLVRTSSELAVRRRKARKSRSQSVPGRHEAVALATLAAQAARQQSAG